MSELKPFGGVYGDVLGKSQEIKDAAMIRAREAEVQAREAEVQAQEHANRKEAGEDLETKHLLEAHGKTVEFLNDFLNLANREKAWIKEGDVLSGNVKTGDVFLRLENKSNQAHEGVSRVDHFLLPIPQDKIESLKALFALSERDRMHLLWGGFYSERSGISKVSDTLDQEESSKYSGISPQLFDLLTEGVYFLSTKDVSYKNLAGDIAIGGLGEEVKSRDHHQQKLELKTIE